MIGSAMAPAPEAHTPDGAWVLVLDVGSSSSRAWFYDARGEALPGGPPVRVRYGWELEGGRMEMPAGALLAAVEEVVEEALRRARGDGIQLSGVAIATFWHSLLGVDGAGAPATALTGWGDARAAATALALAERHDAAGLHGRTGCFLHPSYPLARLAWLRAEAPELCGKVSWWGSFADWLEATFFGAARTSHSLASGTGLLDVRTLEWDGEALEIAGLTPARLPSLVDAAEPRSGLREPYRSRWPELAEIPWFPALGDGACANLGSGAIGRARLGLTVGTTAAARLLLGADETLTVPPDLWVYRLDRERWIAGGAVSNGGAVLAFLSHTLALPSPPDWDAVLAATAPDGHGLTVVPELVAERAPARPHGPGAAVLGLSQESAPEEIARAFLEASAYRVAEVCRRLRSAFGAPEMVMGSGGALHGSRGWAQLLADVLGRPVRIGAEREETSRGAALMAWRALGAPTTLVPPPALETLYPDLEHTALHARAMERQARAEAALAALRQPPAGIGEPIH
jgi:gluconokinase